MFRRIVPAVLFVICACVYAWAAERATFIMTDGARKTGTLVAHGGRNYNLIDDNLNLAEGGREQSYPVENVAVIDFENAQPSTTELSALPNEQTNVLVLRNGYSQHGKFVNIVNGDTVLWQNAGGQQQQYGARDVARIYLNPPMARMAYGYSGAPAPSQPAPVGTSGQTIRLEGNVPWVDPGMMVRRGDRLSFSTSGEVSVAPGVNAGPAGNPTLHGNYPVPSAAVGSLIGRIDNGAPFPIGSNTGPITMPTNGRLMLGVNDDNFADNGGFFSVTINRQ